MTEALRAERSVGTVSVKLFVQKWRGGGDICRRVPGGGNGMWDGAPRDFFFFLLLESIESSHGPPATRTSSTPIHPFLSSHPATPITPPVLSSRCVCFPYSFSYPPLLPLQIYLPVPFLTCPVSLFLGLFLSSFPFLVFSLLNPKPASLSYEPVSMLFHTHPPNR